MPPRQQNPSALVARIQDYDLRSCSDAQLRDHFALLASQASGATADDLLCYAFAIVAESVDRRLGAWRLFGEPSPDLKELERYNRDSIGVSDGVAAVVRQRQFRRDGDILLPAEFYRAVRCADPNGCLSFRVTGEQLLAGIHLFRGKVVQMDAGEGKTVAAAFPAALHALLGHPIHLITANDYLADRDSKLLEPVYQSLGVSVGAVLQHIEDGERRQVYRRNIVYGSMRELGFDYLRDNLKTESTRRVQPTNVLATTVAIVDEADHALIDEAFTPMIISGNPMGSPRAAIRADRTVSEMVHCQQTLAAKLADELEPPKATPADTAQRAARLLLAEPDHPALKRHFANLPRGLKRAWNLAEDDYSSLTDDLLYAIHPGQRFVTLTDKGREFLEQRLGPLYDGVSTPTETTPRLAEHRRGGHRASRKMSRRYSLGNQVLQSLRAHLLLKRDVDYLVGDDEVVLIDQHTGRAKLDSVYQHGLQAAVEAREGVTVHPEGETLSWLSVAGFVGRYGQVSGITGTADTAAGEFRSKYGLQVAVVRPANPSMRTVRTPCVYLSREDKISAVVDQVECRHRMGQPVLVAARTVRQSEELSHRLAQRGIPHSLLNAVTSATEARIVREAGNFGAVTVSTPMAGRGTDIVLEPALNQQLARRCVEEARRVLAAEARTVEVSCPSAEQAAVLEGELDGLGLPYVVLQRGEDVCVSVEGGKGEGCRQMEFALGLCVIGTEIYDSRRTELQLYGRSGRQGEFGLTQTFLSLEDRMVDLNVDSFLKLRESDRADTSRRDFYSGPKVARLVERLQTRADSEEEFVRGLFQDYSAEFDRQTHLYYQRRQQVADSTEVWGPCREAAGHVASRLAAEYLGPQAEDGYPQRFRGMASEARQHFGVDCSSLYGTDLTLLPGALGELFQARLEDAAERAGRQLFPGLARLLFLQVCAELWPGHLASLRDLVACQMLGGLGHKSAVAQYVSRSQDAWREFWEAVDAEFVSRLFAFPFSPAPEVPQVAVSNETQLLLAQEAPSQL